MKSLALHGGPPVRGELLPYGRQSIEQSDVEAVIRVLSSDWLTTGPAVEAFEEAFAEVVGAGYAVAVSSGTAALHAALAVAGVGAGDEVLTTPITFCATSNCVLQCGAEPVFCDVEPERLTVDPERVRERIGPRTRALLPVDFAGHPAELETLMELAEEHGLLVIEDAAHALGARLGERPVGSIAHLTTFSFHPVKHLACGEGGMVTTGDAELAARLRRFRNHGLSSTARERRAGARWAYDMLELGTNYRLTDMASALGLSQLGRLAENLERRRETVRRYDAAFADLAEVRTLVEREGCRSAWHLYPVRLDTQALTTDRDELLAALRAEGIGVNVHYVPVPSLSYYRELGHRAEDYPQAQASSAQLISLPLFHGMQPEDAEDVIEAVHKVVEHFRA